MVGGFALKNVRIWFSKCGTAKYISHLDLNRCMARAFHRAKLPIWYTEGFNPHAFVTFALPLSLGVEGRRESMDIRLLEDVPKEELISRLNNGLPTDIRVYDVTEPQMKPGKITYADYEIHYNAQDRDVHTLAEQLNHLLQQDEILVQKKAKSGERTVNLQGCFGVYELTEEQEVVVLRITLPAGSVENINPALFMEAAQRYLNCTLHAQTVRLNLYDEQMQEFA